MNFWCCFNTVEENIDHPIGKLIKNGLTNNSIVTTIDKIEENILEKNILPGVISIVGQDLSGVIQNVIITHIEPVLEKITNSELNFALTVGENTVKPIITEIETNIPFSQGKLSVNTI